jgi:hypothetical protein
MSVDTRAILRKGVTIEQIEKAISEKYTEVKVHTLVAPDFILISFMDGVYKRIISVSLENSYERDYGIAGVGVSLGFWGNSVKILTYLCETFGGYLDENDCDDEGFYPINFHLYSQGDEFTKLDEFRHKVINSVGYDKINTVMELFNEYKTLC